MPPLSRFAAHFAHASPIFELMEDLGDALNNNPDIQFLGGGNPAHVPEAAACFAKHLRLLAQGPDKMLGVYQSPQGDEQTIQSLVAYYRKQCGWNINANNIALVNGSQTAFFILLNLFAGTNEQGEKQKILLPLVPEYLGYESQILEENCFVTRQPLIKEIGPNRFKYQLHLKHDTVEPGVSALCCSRPTNPSGNVLTDEEIESLAALAKKNHIPLIIDNAYGQPFPNLIHVPSTAYWDDNVISVSSLSKLGLPGARTGVVVANEEVIQQLVRVNIVLSLANGNLGTQLLNSLLASSDIDLLTDRVLPQFYRTQRDAMVKALDAALVGIDYLIHEPEGAFFIWLWLPKLSVSSDVLYQRLKEKNVLVMSGTPFFFDQKAQWPHAQQCLRLSYCQPITVLQSAVKIIAETVREFN